MTLEQKYNEIYEIGFPIFQKLFQLNKADFIKVMVFILKDYKNKHALEILENNPRVVKIIHDDEPYEINIEFYSSIIVSHVGINYKPEHGASFFLVRFDKFFNVDATLMSLQS